MCKGCGFEISPTTHTKGVLKNSLKSCNTDLLHWQFQLRWRLFYDGARNWLLFDLWQDLFICFIHKVLNELYDITYIIHIMYESYFVSHFIWPICYALCKWTIIYSFSTFNDVCIFIVGFFLDKVIYRLGNKWSSLDPKWLSESPCWVTCEAPARVALGITTYLSIKTMVKSYLLNLNLT